MIIAAENDKCVPLWYHDGSMMDIHDLCARKPKYIVSAQTAQKFCSNCSKFLLKPLKIFAQTAQKILEFEIEYQP